MKIMKDSIEKEYDDKYSNQDLKISSYFKNQFDYILKLSNKKINGTILDLGCGTGEYSLFFQKMGYDVLGIDISEIAISKAKKNGVKKAISVNFLDTDIKEKFDFIFVKGFSPLNTSDQSEFEKIIEKLDQMLDNNGVIFYWGITNFSNKYSKSGWYNWNPNYLNHILKFHLFLVFRWQTYLPVKVNNIISSILILLKPSFKQFTLVGYKYKKK